MLIEHFIGFTKTEAKLTIYDYKQPTVPIFCEVIDKAQEMVAYWSPDGQVCLFMTQTNLDETGKSYYGQTHLFYFDVVEKKLKKVPTYDGPIHDVSWNPNS